jgi:hypothetical protein
LIYPCDLKRRKLGSDVTVYVSRFPLWEIDVSDNDPTAAQSPSPHIRLIQMANAYLPSRIVYAAAKLSLADQLAGGPKSAVELASPLRAHAPWNYESRDFLAKPTSVP